MSHLWGPSAECKMVTDANWTNIYYVEHKCYHEHHCPRIGELTHSVKNQISHLATVLHPPMQVYLDSLIKT
jgi:hypothetical protein